jgi:hypothetical protein
MVFAFVSYWCIEQQMHQHSATRDHFGAKLEAGETAKQVKH